MKDITSSQSTFMLKRVTPCLLVGWVAFVECIAISSKLQQGAPSSHVVFAITFGIMVIAVFTVAYVKLIYPIADAVFDNDDVIVLRRRKTTVTVPLCEILNVNYSQFSRPQMITLQFCSETPLGKQVSFLPPSRFWPFSKHPVVQDLIVRIDAEKRKAATE